MLAQVEVWEKENIQSAQSFAQNLAKDIRETEVKLDRLVNAFLDGSIEKETYLAKKDELITTKTDLQRRKSDFGQKGNNWIEPLRDWILAAHHAEKLASSNEFDEIKSLVEKIGTNRRLLSKQVLVGLRPLFDLIPKQKGFCEARPAEGGASEQTLSLENLTCLEWSGCRESDPVLTHPKGKYCRCTTARSLWT